MIGARQRPVEWWIGVIRLLAVPFAVIQLALTTGISDHDRAVGWGITGCFGLGAVVLFALGTGPGRWWLPYVGQLFDFAVVSSFVLLFAYEQGTPTRQLLLLVIVAGSIRFGMRGGIATALACVPVVYWFETRRSALFHTHFRVDYVTFQAGSGLIMAALVGWLVSRVDFESESALRRAEEAEQLRDELGRRADVLDATNRCVRALNSSLDLDEAVTAFIRELRGLVPFHRMAIVLTDEGAARVIATAGEDADVVMPPGTVLPLTDNLAEEVVRGGQTVVRGDMLRDQRYAEEAELVALGLRSRVVAPLLVGARAIGIISVGRAEADAFSRDDVELVSLLGRLAASAVQNIRAYDSERRTVDELRRLSTLRADFVSLVSHELRSPMAAVIGAARTLQLRWRELQPEQREAFLALIGDETSRLASLIADVLDTSRIDAGTFTYRFSDVDVGAIVEDAVAAAAVGQDEVPVRALVASALPTVRGDADRLRQVVSNLIDNAVKYTPAGTPVEVSVSRVDGVVDVAVADRGPGIAAQDQRLIFEKFGRVATSASKPGTGLGLFIARSIVEAHGGTLEVTSAPGRGATFRLRLPTA